MQVVPCSLMSETTGRQNLKHSVSCGQCAILVSISMGHTCHVFTDHEALKLLLHQSGKLARWGLSIQELDLHVHCRPGCKNEKADALSRSAPLTSLVKPMIAAVEPVAPCLHQKAGIPLSLTSKANIEHSPHISLIWRMVSYHTKRVNS